MSAHTLSYQQMPDWLLHPVMEGAILLSEASQLWDQWLLMGQPDRFTPDSPRLQQAAMRIRLLSDGDEPSPTCH